MFFTSSDYPSKLAVRFTDIQKKQPPRYAKVLAYNQRLGLQLIRMVTEREGEIVGGTQRMRPAVWARVPIGLLPDEEKLPQECVFEDARRQREDA